MAIEPNVVLGLIPLETSADAISAPYAHDRALIGASMLVAVVLAYAFLELLARARAHRNAASMLWNAAAGLVFGVCVWLTHLMGMLALDSPLVRGLEFTLTAVSGVVGIASGCLAFVVAGERLTWLRLIAAGVCVALGGVAMHYLGMRGLEIEAAVTYRAPMIIVTSVGAGVSTVVALWLAHRLDKAWLRGVLAFPMGATVAALHYTDMAAMVISPRPTFDAPAPGASEPWQALGIGLAAICVVVASLCAAVIDRLAAERDQLEAERNIVEIPGPNPDSEGVIEVRTTPRNSQ